MQKHDPRWLSYVWGVGCQSCWIVMIKHPKFWCPIPEFRWPVPGQESFMKVCGIYEFDDSDDLHHPICSNFVASFFFFPKTEFHSIFPTCQPYISIYFHSFPYIVPMFFTIFSAFSHIFHPFPVRFPSFCIGRSMAIAMAGPPYRGPHGCSAKA